MYKLKTNSSAKKRFKLLPGGKLKSTQAYKQHLLRKRSGASARSLKGMTILEGKQAKNIIKYFLCR